MRSFIVLRGKRARFLRVTAFLICLPLGGTGCATTVPYVGQGPHPQLERGAPFPPVDFLGNVLSLIAKFQLLSWKFNNHAISSKTEAKLIEYLDDRNLALLSDTKFRLNQYKPFHDLGRLVKNRHVAWPYRLLIGLPVTLLTDVLLPGRLFPWGDYYNPYTNTVHLYSDLPAVALHEAGHAHDFATKRYKGSYALFRIVPFIDLYQEFQATNEAIDHTIAIGDHDTEFQSYRVLYPAYGTYVARYINIIFPVGFVFVIFGHIYGRKTAIKRQRLYHQMGTMQAAPHHPAQNLGTSLPAVSAP